MEKVLLLFVHGLGGDQTTWGQFPALIAQDEELSTRVEVAFYGYPTRRIRMPWSKRSNRIQDLSKGIRTEFSTRFQAYSKVVIVAHSMGGLIAQKYIVEQLKENLSLRVTGLVLFAVPTAGAGIARWGDLISFRHFHLRQLRKESETLESIRDDWRKLNCSGRVKVVAVYGGQDKIIARASDMTECSEFIPDEDHQSIVKPKSPSSTAFLIVKNLLLDHLSKSKIAEKIAANETTGKSVARDEGTSVLFDVYRPEHERYYIERREDILLSGYIPRQNIWLFGPSGYGKTAALTRCLTKEASFRLVSLGHYAGCSVRELFAALHSALAAGNDVISADVPWPRLIEATVAELDKLCRDGLRWILVEEMPIGDPQALSEFLSKLSSLLILHNRSQNPQPIAFAFSSIADPREGVRDLDRVSQILKVIKFGEWRIKEAEQLFLLIRKQLNIELSAIDQKTILNASGMSPRFIKVFFGNYLSLLPMMREPQAAMEEALASTRSEVLR